MFIRLEISLSAIADVPRFKFANPTDKQSVSQHSGFTFSHYDLPFPTRYCIPYVRSGLYQLVIRVKGFRVCALHCDLAITLITHCIIRFGPSAWTPRFQRVELRIASVWTTLAVSAVAPSWSYSTSAAANEKPFVNKDLCTRKSVKRTIKVMRAKRLASAWQLKPSGSFSLELNQYSYND